jgi:hypothetical protein
MSARGQSIDISIDMLPQTLIMSRLINFCDLAHEFSFFIIHNFFFFFWGDIEAITIQKTSKYYTVEFNHEEEF